MYQVKWSNSFRINGFLMNSFYQNYSGNDKNVLEYPMVLKMENRPMTSEGALVIVVTKLG